MRQVAACVPCYLRQVQSTLEVAGADEDSSYRVWQEVLPVILALDRSRSPAENSSVVLHRAYAVLGAEDPFRAARAKSNHEAWAWLPYLEKRRAQSRDRLLFALGVSVMGNMVDMGILPGYDLEANLRELDELVFARFDYPELAERLARAEKILVVGDNSGEIVWDRLLLEELGRGGRRVSYAVKAGPILNDATWSDAEEARLEQVAEVIDTGSNYLGVVEERCSPAFLSALAASDLVIAKGQANYETLEGTRLAGDKTFFLLRAKCPVVAAHLRVPRLAAALVRNRPEAGS
ncbi:MAG: ARMT1-like domain-containing protein [Clostridia bacterium]|nr:ARMT1-like domain-containing protein [Clostridia bacterium]MDH7572960.1 ARMT1-like domain-containing protein [Clostridia bacterium]